MMKDVGLKALLKILMDSREMAHGMKREHMLGRLSSHQPMSPTKESEEELGEEGEIALDPHGERTDEKMGEPEEMDERAKARKAKILELWK